MRKLPKRVVGAGALAALGGVLVVAGCTEFEVASRGMDFNTALEDHDNEQILINVVRESKARPLYFSQITQLSTSGVFDHSSLTLGVPVGPVGAKKWSVTPTLGLQEGIGVTLAPLDTSDFWNPMINPTNAGEFVYYAKYGWASGVVFSLFIDKVTMTKGQFKLLRLQAEKINSDNKECAGDFYDPSIRPSQLGLPPCFVAPNDAELHAMGGGCGLHRPQFDFAVDDLRGAEAAKPIKFTNAVPRSGYTPAEVCAFYKFQYFTQVLTAFVDRLSVVQIAQGAVAAPSAPAASPPGGGSSPKPGGAGPSPSGPGAGGATPAYRLELDLGAAASCDRPKDLVQEVEALQQRLTSYHQAAGASDDDKNELASLKARIADLAGKVTGPAAPTKLDFVTAPLGEASSPPPSIAGLGDFETAVTQLDRRTRENECDTAALPTMLLNSTENMFYYLGTVLLADDGALRPPSPAASGAPTDPCRAGSALVPKVFTRWIDATPDEPRHAEFQPLFVVCNAAQSTADAELSVSYDHDTYFIPKPTPGRTMSVLQLVQQLVALQRSSSLLLPVPTVRVLGQ